MLSFNEPPAKPRPAAALILVDTGEPPKVLLAKRNENLAFMGGQYCFPGGRVHSNEIVDGILSPGHDDRREALVAAVRETFEETGLLCVHGDLPPVPAIQSAREATVNDYTAFGEFLREHKLWIDASEFDDAGLWTTPPISPIRYRTHYFIHRYTGPKNQDVHDDEIVDVAWMNPHDARRKWRLGNLETSTPVGFVLSVLANERAHEWPHALRQVPNTRAGIPGRFELRWGIYLIPLRSDTLPPATHTNCIVIGDDELVVIDPGPTDPAERETLIEQLGAFRMGRSKIRAILLTHSHRDHMSAVEPLRQRFRAPVWAHALTGEQLDMPLDRHLDDGDIIELPGDPPWRLRCIHTPGHDPGHLGFLEESTGMLIAGDMVANPGSIYIAPKLGGDMTAYLDSLERLKSFAFDRIVPGHGIPLQSGAHDLIQHHIDHRLRREAKIKKALLEKPRDFQTLLRKVYDDVDDSALVLAEGSLRAHLVRLDVRLP